MFGEFRGTVSLKNKTSQTITNSSEIILLTSKRKPNLLETDDGKNFVNKIFNDLLNKNNIKRYTRNTSLRAVSAEPFNRTIRDLLERLVFEKGGSNWVDVLPTNETI